jgi:hydroxyacylglutathione hydrolase
MYHPLQIIAIPAFKDNYIWLIHNNTHALVVDPGDALPVISTLNLLQLQLAGILITHHHQDHIGGVDFLIENYPAVDVYAPSHEQYSFVHRPVTESDVVRIQQLNIALSVIDLPGHTLGHVAYYSADDHQKLLFCGDTLFGAGCGRLFEGTAEQMLNSLQKLANLPIETEVYCTHEYTLHNIDFALTLEPNNQDLIQRQLHTIELRSQHQPSLPSTIALELATNPFLRCHSQEIQSSIDLKNSPLIDVFSKIRELRNHY